MLGAVLLGRVTVPLVAAAAKPELGAVYLGQDGHDFCTTDRQLQPNDIQDLHLRLEGLPAQEDLASATFTRAGGGAWSYSKSPQPTRHFRAELLRQPNAPVADVFLEPTFDEAEFRLHVELDFASGRKAEFDVKCGRSDLNRFMPDAVVHAAVGWPGGT